MSSFCLGCGNSMAEGERFCGSCGRDSLAAPSPPVDPAVAFGLPAETSGKAIFSLICGIIVLFFPFSICAVIFGYLALWDIRKSPGRLTGRGLAISGILLGYLGLALTIGFIGFGIYSVRTEERRMKERSASFSLVRGENTAVAGLRTLNTAEIAYSQAHRDRGYTCSLSELSGAWGISAELARGRKNGYVFQLRHCLPDKADGPIVKYEIVAYPEGPGNSGGPAYCSDQSDVIRTAKNGSGNDCVSSGINLSESEITHAQGRSKNASR